MREITIPKKLENLDLGFDAAQIQIFKLLVSSKQTRLEGVCKIRVAGMSLATCSNDHSLKTG